MAINQLTGYIFPDSAHPLAAEFAGWVAASPRFREFAETYRDKIRKKLRGARDEQFVLDLRCEFEVAYLLLGSRSFELEYEKGGVGKQRAADFYLTFKTHTAMNVEVRRIRAGEQAPSPLGKLASTLGQKLGQLAPGMLNMLVLHYDALPAPAFEPAAAMNALQLHAQQADDLFFSGKGFDSARDFLRQLQRLSAALFMLPQRPSQPLWLNPAARPRLPDDLRRALMRL